MPRGNSKEKRLARQRQAATGKPYTECLREIRAEYAAQQATQTVELDDDEDDPPVRCWHTEPDSPCDWDVCRQPDRLAAGDYGTDPAEGATYRTSGG